MGFMKKEYRRTPHTVYDLKYHFVWVPKYRYCVLESGIKKRLEEMISEICEGLGVIIMEGKISKDHIHMCMSR